MSTGSKRRRRASKADSNKDLLSVRDLRAAYPMLGRAAAYALVRALGRRLGRRFYVRRGAVEAWLSRDGEVRS